MKQFIVLCALVAAVAGSWKGGLRAKFDIGPNPGQTFFYKVPTSVEEAKSMTWQLLDRPKGPRPELVMYCAFERNLCSLYDDMENVAGLQVAIPQDEYTDAELDWTTQGFTTWSPPPRDGESAKTYWTLQQYFVSDVAEDGLLLTGINGELLKVPGTTNEIEQTIFTKQACIPGMGLHYYYDMKKNSLCTSESMYPWFLLVNEGKLVATGFTSFGKLPIRQNEKNWFERPPLEAVKAIVPVGPQCLYDMAEQVGLVTMHIYYVDEPWLITC